MFVVVEWETSEMSVLKSGWITPRKSQGYWPPVKSIKSLNKILQAKENKIYATWLHLHPIKKIWYETDDIVKALGKCKVAEETSNLDTVDDDEDNLASIKLKRRIKARRRFSESDDDEEVSDKNQLEKIRPPRLNLDFHKEGNKRTNFETPSIRRNNLPPSVKTPTQRAEIPTITPILSSSLVDEINNCINPADNQIVELLLEIRQQNYQIIKRLDTLRKPSDDGVDAALSYKFPLANLLELDQLENDLIKDESFKNLVAYLGRIGGKDGVSCTNRILKTLFSDELASFINFRGRQGKRAFDNLTIKKVVTEAVQKNVNITVAEVENATKIWLKHAPDRLRRATNNSK